MAACLRSRFHHCQLRGSIAPYRIMARSSAVTRHEILDRNRVIQKCCDDIYVGSATQSSVRDLSTLAKNAYLGVNILPATICSLCDNGYRSACQGSCQ